MKALFNGFFYFYLWFSAPVRDFSLASSYEKLKTQSVEHSKFFAEKIGSSCCFRWRYYMKCNHANTYNCIYGDPKTPEDQHYKTMVDYYSSMVGDCSYHLSLRGDLF